MLSQWIPAVATAAQLKVNAQVLGMNGNRRYAGSRRDWASTINRP